MDKRENRRSMEKGLRVKVESVDAKDVFLEGSLDPLTPWILEP